MSAPIVFLDTETDGVHPDRKVWEIGMIRRDGDEQRETSFFVEIDLSTADPFGLKVGRFYERHPLGREISGITQRPALPDGMRHWNAGPMPMSRHSAALTVAGWTHGAHIVGAVPNFDTEVLARLLRDQGLTPSWHYHLIDVEALAVGYLAGRWAQAEDAGNAEPGPFDPGLPWNSDQLSTAIGVSPAASEERHTALGDARWVSRMYDVILNGGVAHD
jgi:hypothetical protein